MKIHVGGKITEWGLTNKYKAHLVISKVAFIFINLASICIISMNHLSYAKNFQKILLLSNNKSS